MLHLAAALNVLCGLALERSSGAVGSSGLAVLRSDVALVDTGVDTVGLVLLLQELLWVLAEVSSVDVGLDTSSVSWELLADLLVGLQCCVELFHGCIVNEVRGSDGLGDNKALLAVSGLEDSLGTGLEEVLVEKLVVHGKTNSAEEPEDLVSLSLGDVAAGPGQSGGVGHIDRDGVSVTKRNVGLQLESWRPGVAECNDTVKTDLVQVGRLKLPSLRSVSN